MVMQFMRSLFFLFLFLTFSCAKSQESVRFSEKALAEKMISLEGKEVAFSEILERYKGKKIVLEVWASWCADCIQGMSKIKEFQKSSDDAIIYLFLSLDRDIGSWKRGIEKYQVEGVHYFMPSGWKGDFNTSIELDWIPRYMVVDKKSEIVLWKAKKATNEELAKAIKFKN